MQAKVWRGTSATSGETDTQYLWVTPNGLANQVVFSGKSNAQSWETVSYNLTALKGGSVQILFGVFNNGSGGKTVMYADEVTVTRCP